VTSLREPLKADSASRARLALLLAAAVALGGCAHSGQARQQSELDELTRTLPGEYSGTSADGDAVTFTVSAVTAQLIGDNVFFVRETPSNNSRLVLWQGIWTMVGETSRSHDPGKGDALRIVQHNSLFKEPRRFAQADSNPELLESMLPQDLKALAGCDLVWHKDTTGFATAGTPDSCRPGNQVSGQWMAQGASLHGSQLILTERQIDDAGALDLRGAPRTLQLSRSGSAP
jgi:hypothetical protein